MILYNGQSLTVKDKFRPESMSLTLEERKSQASLTIGPDAPEISVGDWMRDDTEPGSGILWRVKSVSDQVEKQTRTVALEHISATLRDCVIFGEWEPEGGCTAQAAVNYALAQTGGLWELGDWEVSNPTNPYKFASTTVFGAIETVSASVSGVFWEYDLSAIPFRLHMRLISDSAASEMRMSRNILSLKRSVDRSRMYTRIYPIGADDLHITGDYLSKNENIYGRVDHIETDQSKDSAAELQRWAQERLNTHCEPAVSIQISGLDYSRETGEALDALAIGTRSRVPLPEYGTTILETLTRLQWKDKIAKPEEVTVNLANIQEDVASIFRKVSGSAASNSRAGGRGSKKKKEEDHAWFVDTTDHVAMVAEAIIGKVDGETSEHLWSRVSTIVVDENGIHQRVTANADGIAMHGTAIEQNENAISLAVGTYQIDPDKILRYSGGTGSFPSEGQTGYYYLDTSVTPNRMYIWKDGKYNLLQVSGDGAKGFLIKAGEIAIALNESGDAEAHIDAKKVILGQSALTADDLADWAKDPTNGGGVFAKYIISKSITVGTITVNDAADVDGIKVSTIAQFGATAGNQVIVNGNTGVMQIQNELDINSTGKLSIIGTESGEHYDLDYSTLRSMIRSASLSTDGKTLTLTPFSGSAINFSKATTLEAAWSSGSLTVNAYQTNNGIKSRVAQFVSAHELNLNGNGSANFSVEMKTQDTGESVQTVRDSKYIYLYENVNGASSTVVAGENSDGTGAVGSISTRATYNAGKTAGNAEGQAEYKALVRSRFGSASGNYYIEGYESNSGNAITGSSTAYKLGTSGSTTATTVQIQDSTGARIANTAELAVGSLYTEGANSIINAGGPISETANCNAKAINQYVTTLTINVPSAQDTPWLTPGDGGLTSDGTLGYNTYYRIVRGDGTTPSQVVGGVTHYAVWKTPADRWQDGWDAGYPISYTEMDGGSVSTDSGSISGRKYIGAISRPSSHSYVKFSITCRGVTRMFYITVN